MSDYVDSFYSLDSDVESWSNEFVSQLSSIGVECIYTKVTEGIDEIGCIVVLDKESFLKSCKSNGVTSVFVKNEFIDIDESLRNWLWNELGGELEGSGYVSFSDISEKAISRFYSDYSELIKETKDACRSLSRQEVFYFDGNAVIVCGARSETYELFLDKLIDFVENYSNEIKSELIFKEDENESILAEIRKDLLGDKTFVSLKGLRKRCFYVEEKYKDKIPKSRHLAKPDKTSPYMDETLINFVQEISDRIEIAKVLSIS